MRRRSRRLFVALGSAAAAMAAYTGVSTREAAAQEPQRKAENLVDGDSGADTHLFRPAVDSKGFLSVNGADVVGHLDFSVGLLMDYGYGIMPTTEGKHGPEGDYLLQHSFQGTLQFDLGVANLLVFGISAPVVLAGHNTLTNITGSSDAYTVAEDFAQGLEYIALHAKIRIIRPEDRPSVGLAAIVQGGVGVAGSDNLIGENGGFVWPQVVFEGRAAPGGIFRIGLNAGFRANFGGTNAVYGVDSDGDPVLDSGIFEYGQLVTAGLAASIRVVDPLDIIAETYSSFLVTGENDTAQRISAEAIGGLKVFIDGKSFLMLGGGAGYAPGFQTATARGTVGFVFEPSIGDRDGDGFKDDEDDCPDVPEDKDGFEDTRSDSPPGKLGCPDPDNDNDGILDVDDSCPNNPEDKDGDEDSDGCPESRDGDRDGDGILDSRDKCPDDPEDKDGQEDEDGCPEPDPEPTGPVVISGDDILILEKVQFATGSARILPASDKILDEVAKTLKAHSEFTLLEIQGHADERSNDNFNLQLTKDRAKSVMEALIKRGIAKNRLRSMGFGEYCPLDEAHNETAWEKNRRVEFKIVRKDTGPTGAKLGCELASQKGINSPPP